MLRKSKQVLKTSNRGRRVMTEIKRLPARGMGRQNQRYCSSMLAQEQHLAGLSHNKQRGTMQNTLSFPAYTSCTIRQEHEAIFGEPNFK